MRPQTRKRGHHHLPGSAISYAFAAFLPIPQWTRPGAARQSSYQFNVCNARRNQSKELIGGLNNPTPQPSRRANSSWTAAKGRGSAAPCALGTPRAAKVDLQTHGHGEPSAPDGVRVHGGGQLFSALPSARAALVGVSMCPIEVSCEEARAREHGSAGPLGEE